MRSKSTHKKNTIEQIAAQLNVDIKATEGFVAEVRQLVGPVKYIVILNTLRRVKDPRQTSPEAVASLIPSPTLKTPREKQQKSRPITKVISILQPVTTKSSRPTTIAQIAIELHGDIRGAKSFAAQVRAIMSGRHIKDNQILRAIKQIGDWRKVTPDKVASLLYVPVSEKDKISEIAKELTVNIRSAEAFVFQVWKLYGSNIEHQEILAAIERVKNREQIITPQAVVSEFSPNKGQVTPKKIVIAKATQVNKSIFTASTLVEEFEADSHQSTQNLFAELGLQLVSGEHLLSAKDNSTYPLSTIA